MTWARGQFDSPHGTITSHWTTGPDSFVLEITVPANTTATVYVPAADEADVSESDQPAALAMGVKFVRMDSGTAIYDVARRPATGSRSAQPAARCDLIAPRGRHSGRCRKTTYAAGRTPTLPGAAEADIPSSRPDRLLP